MTSADKSEESREDWVVELENRYQLMRTSHGDANEFVQSFGAKLEMFKQGASLTSLMGSSNADRICLKCENGYYLDGNGKCQMADSLDHCEVF